MTTSTYAVQGMTCGHCVNAVTEEVGKIAGVTEVGVDPGSGRVTVSSDQPVESTTVGAAVEEAGYELVG